MINLDNYQLPTDDTMADLLKPNEDDGDFYSEDELRSDDEKEIAMNKQQLFVFTFYSTEKRNSIFVAVPEGCRFYIVSTNMAKTSGKSCEEEAGFSLAVWN